MQANKEGVRRLAWIASGALLLVWAWHIYSRSDDYYFGEASTWIQISIVSLILVVLPHVAYRALIWAFNGFAAGRDDHANVSETPKDEHSQARANISVINFVASEISAQIVRSTPNPETNHGPMHDVLKNMLKPTASQYALALLQLNRLQKRRDFFASEENLETKKLLTEQIAFETIAFTDKNGTDGDRELILLNVAKEIDAVSYAASKFVRLMINNQVNKVPNPLHAWFKDAFGIELVGSTTLDEFTKSMLRRTRSELQRVGG